MGAARTDVTDSFWTSANGGGATHKPEFEGEAGKLTPVSHRFSSVQWSDVLTIRNGKNQKAVECPEGEYPICGSGGEMGRASAFITKGDSVIIGRKGNISSPILMREPFWNVDTAFGLEPNEERLTVEYLYYFCERFNFEKLNKAVTIPSLTKADLLKIDMPLPPINLQREFTDRVVLIDNLKVLLENVKQALDDLVKSQFVEMFGDPVANEMGWAISTVKDSATVYGDGPFGSNLKSSDYVDEGVRVIRLGNIAQGHFSEKDRSFISFEKFETLKKFECRPGEVVIATLGDPILRACLVPKLPVPSIHKADCMYYQVDRSKLLPIFAMCVINHPSMLRRAQGDTHGQTRGRINSTQTGNLPMVLPPLALQQQFADFVARVDKLGFDVQQQIEKLETLKQSLMQEYFG